MVLSVLNVLLDACVSISGLMGAVGVWKNDMGSFVLSLVDLLIIVLGIFIVFLEASMVSWGGGGERGA